MPQEHAAYLTQPEYKATKKDLPLSTALRHDDPLSRHRLSYLNGGRGSGKTTRAIELFRTRNPLVFTPTHRLAKGMRARGVQAQTYHSFFRWSDQTDWTPDRMGQKFTPRVIIWDEVCTVLRPSLETFLDWLEGRGVQVICCGDQEQPPPIAGEMPRLAPRACHLLRRGSGGPQGQRPPPQGPQKGHSSTARPSTVSGYEKGAPWLPRVGTLRGGLEAGGLDPDLKGEGPRPGLCTAFRAP